MSEITKLYENAEVKSFKTCEFCTQKDIDCLKENISNITCGLSIDKYPPFTAEKQIELIKWMIKTNHRYLLQNIIVECFSESLAGILNAYWFSLTEEEKQQVKGILE